MGRKISKIKLIRLGRRRIRILGLLLHKRVFGIKPKVMSVILLMVLNGVITLLQMG